MAKKTSKTVYLCSDCGDEFPKWFGQCPSCKEWGTLSEFSVPKSRRRGGEKSVIGGESRKPSSLGDILYRQHDERIASNIPEVDRVLGGGLLKGSLILLGGNPGIGKSTLALQIVGNTKATALYVSAEESEDQIAMRAKRLGIDHDDLQLSGENRMETLQEHIALQIPALVIIDSIQTVYSDALDSLPGSVSQIRECGQQLLQTCKQRNVTVIIIGHVTKEGVIAGPKMLEHMVDTVLYLEGDERYDHRILRSVKNRFGTTNEVGLFQMDAKGLVEVENPSELFLAERTDHVPGAAIYPSLEGTRPILVEVQALVSNANFGTPQRNVNGFDYRRLAMLLAVLEKRMNLVMGTRDVFVNLVGGLKIDDPAADLAILCAVASSTLDQQIPDDVVLVGEVGLTGEVRSVGHLQRRLQEAEALGFANAIVPKWSLERLSTKPKN